MEVCLVVDLLHHVQIIVKEENVLVSDYDQALDTLGSTDAEGVTEDL